LWLIVRFRVYRRAPLFNAAGYHVGMRNQRTLLWTLMLCSLGFAAAQARVVAPEISVQARELAPGEPFRIRVTSPEPAASLRAEVLGRTVFLMRDATEGGRESWSGWAMVGLDDPTGATAIELAGTTESGHEILGTHLITVAEKQFPREELKVAPKYVEPPEAVREQLAAERVKLDAIYASRRDVPTGQQPFVRPVPGERTSIFGMRRVFNGKPRSPHSGLDLRAATGTSVQASGTGRVVLAQDLYYSGNTVIVDHGGGLFTLYAHLSELRVQEGDEAQSGQIVGLSGATGRVTGPHLHWGAKIGAEPFDPTALLDPALFR